MSWPGLVTFTTTAPPDSPASAPPRRMHSSVPSNPSTARTVPFFTTTVWPMSKALTPLAIFRPNAISSSCSRDGLRFVTGPAGARYSSMNVVAGCSVTPSFSNSAAMAPKRVSALRSLSRASIATNRRSGRMSRKRFLGATCPAMIASVTPRRVNVPMSRPSWPILIHSTWSATDVMSGEVSFSNATTTTCRTPRARAARASNSG